MNAKANNASGTAPAEVVAPPADEGAYEEWSRADTLRAPYKVCGTLLKHTRQDLPAPRLEPVPLLCFVNARSGGRMGVELALQMSRAIGRVQVFDIGQPDQTPDKVLSRFYDNLRAAEAANDPRAAHVRQRLRLLVCGGDGTIAWVMGVIKKLRLQPEPPIAIMPLGTGNDLSRTFLWGAAHHRRLVKGYKSMHSTLNRIATAKEVILDCWNITITTPRRSMFNAGVPHCLAQPQTAAAPGAATPAPRHSAHSSSIAVTSAPAYGRNQSSSLTPGGAGPASASLHPAVAATRESFMAGSAMGDRSVAASVAATHGSATALPNIATSSVGSAATTFTTATNLSLHTAAAQAGTSLPPTIVSGAVSTSADEEQGIGVRVGMFWNYFSVGLDAKSAWGFHSLRERRPGCTSSRLANQFWYSAFSCTSGWFCCAQPLKVKVRLEVLRPGPGGDTAGWKPVELPSSVRALVVLNLQSYAGGRNLWGASTSESDRKRGLVQPAYNDRILEVVGLESGWHTGVVMATKGSLLHGRRICQAAGVRLSLQAPYFRDDGEPSHCYMQIDGEPWKQDIPVKDREAPVRVEIVHAGTSRLLLNQPQPLRGASSARGAAKPLQGTISAPVVSAVPEVAPLQAHPSQSQSQTSMQLAAVQSLPQMPAPTPSSLSMGLAEGAHQTSVSGALQPQTHGSASGMPNPAPWVGPGGRPSLASVAGSSTTGAAGEAAASEGGGGGGGSVLGLAGGKQGDGLDLTGAASSPACDSASRALSEDLASGS